MRTRKPVVVHPTFVTLGLTPTRGMPLGFSESNVGSGLSPCRPPSGWRVGAEASRRSCTIQFEPHLSRTPSGSWAAPSKSRSAKQKPGGSKDTGPERKLGGKAEAMPQEVCLVRLPFVGRRPIVIARKRRPYKNYVASGEFFTLVAWCSECPCRWRRSLTRLMTHSPEWTKPPSSSSP
jgi:hypothetical protein